MKREFLLGLQTEQPLSKEVIDAIMAENGRDIQKVRTAFADYDELKQSCQALQQQLLTVQTQQADAAAWEEKYNQAVADHESALAQLRFDHCLDRAIEKAGGRSGIAIRALLDMDALRESEDQPHAIEAALETLKGSSAYLFETETPPPYAWGTGVWQGTHSPAPTTLAGALRERFERK